MTNPYSCTEVTNKVVFTIREYFLAYSPAQSIYSKFVFIFARLINLQASSVNHSLKFEIGSNFFQSSLQWLKRVEFKMLESVSRENKNEQGDKSSALPIRGGNNIYGTQRTETTGYCRKQED